jgi:hypothetical protein
MKLKKFYNKIEKSQFGEMKVNFYKFFDHLINEMRRKHKNCSDTFINRNLKNHFPRLLSSSCSSKGMIKIWTNIPHDDEDALIAYCKNHDKKIVISDIIKMDSSGDWDFEIIMIKSDYFKNREEFDTFIVSKDYRYNDSKVDRIDIENALYRTGLINILINEEDLDFFEYPGTKEEIEQQVVKKELIKIFGDGFSYKKYELIVQDFKILRQDGNFTKSTMKLKEFYLAFLFCTS